MAPSRGLANGLEFRSEEGTCKAFFGLLGEKAWQQESSSKEVSSDSMKSSAVSPNVPSPLCLVLLNLRTAALNGNQFLAVCSSQPPREAAGTGMVG